jgi:hypothetical protein
MGTSSKIIIIFLFFLNILAVFMGYAGIDKLQRYEHPPFHTSSLYTVVSTAHFVPNQIVMFWHSTIGTCLVFAGSIVLPLVASYLIFVTTKIWTGIILMLMSFVLFGLTGLLIWLHAFCDLPH